MNTIDLLNGLHVYMVLLTAIETIGTKDRQNGEEAGTYIGKTVSLSYDFITLKLDIRTKRPGQNKDSAELYLQCTFEIDQQKTLCTEVYCQNKDRENEVKDFIHQQTPAAGYTWDTGKKGHAYSNEILRYLTIADEIAKEGHLCSSGDQYRPGYFSEIITDESSIILKQINRWNSRSLDHKDDYHLRDLEFFIPLHDDLEKSPKLYDFQIGKMVVSFSDHSSPNNRRCGDRIKEKILEEKSKF